MFKKYSKRGFFIVVGFLLSIALIGTLTGCHKKYTPKSLTKTQTCTACGMIIMNYNGPHAEVAWKNGQYTYYGNIIEALPTLFQKADAERVGKIWVQDFSGKTWGSYAGSWINAKKPFYVIDSNHLTSMGIGYLSYSKKEDAQAAVKQYGGYILTYDQITPKVLEQSQALMKNHPETYMPKNMSANMMAKGMGKMKMKN